MFSQHLRSQPISDSAPPPEEGDSACNPSSTFQIFSDLCNANAAPIDSSSQPFLECVPLKLLLNKHAIWVNNVAQNFRIKKSLQASEVKLLQDQLEILVAEKKALSQLDILFRHKMADIYYRVGCSRKDKEEAITSLSKCTTQTGFLMQSVTILMDEAKSRLRRWSSYPNLFFRLPAVSNSKDMHLESAPAPEAQPSRLSNHQI